MGLYSLHISPNANDADTFRMDVGEFADTNVFIPHYDGDSFLTWGEHRHGDPIHAVINYHANDDAEAWEQLTRLYEALAADDKVRTQVSCHPSPSRWEPYAITSAWDFSATLDQRLDGTIVRSNDEGWAEHNRMTLQNGPKTNTKPFDELISRALVHAGDALQARVEAEMGDDEDVEALTTLTLLAHLPANEMSPWELSGLLAWMSNRIHPAK